MRGREAGFTLIELLVALVVLAVAVSVLGQALLGQTAANTGNEERQGAAVAVRRVLEATRAEDPSTLPTSGQSSQNVTVGARTYAVVLDYCSAPAYCTGSARSLRARATVGTREILRVETVFTSVSARRSS